jgi:hypothetical protein
VLPTGRRRKKVFAENPLGFGRFLDIIETESFAIFGTSNGVQIFRNLTGAFREIVKAPQSFVCKLLKTL